MGLVTVPNNPKKVIDNHANIYESWDGGVTWFSAF